MILAYINEVCIILSAISMGIGWRYIRLKKIEVHKRWMLTGSFLAALFFLTYVLKTVLVGDTQFGGPHSLSGFYYTFLQAHSILATVAAVLGIITLVFAFRQTFTKHRKIGPWTVTIWFITAATGLVVFILLYIAFPSGPTANVWKAWIGH